jgi:hypothetical protein
MCTVSFIARKHGYLLGMNRDEKLTRVQALPPAKASLDGRVVLCPYERSGGTWIAVNDTGGSFVLINWYTVKAPAHLNPVSRGKIVSRVKPLILPALAMGVLKRLPLKRMKPFRLIGIFLASKKIYEWRWDLKQLVCKPHLWQTQQFISSGFDEPTAQRLRAETFRQRRRQRSFGTLKWLRRLHRSHSPKAGPFSTCMHRAEAATVSYTELNVSASRVTMRYVTGAPCKQRAVSLRTLQLRH